MIGKLTSKAGNDTPSGKDTPDHVKNQVVGFNVRLANSKSNHGNKSSHEDTKALHRKNRGNHGPTALNRGEFRSNDSRNGVVTSNTDAEHETPPGEDDEESGEPARGGGTDHGAAESARHQDHEFDTVDFLAAENVAEHAEAELTDQVAV